MKKKIDTDMPMGKLTRVKDFLPSPSKLAMPRKDVKITIALSNQSVEFFKKQAKTHHTKYQRMIREVVDRYASYYSSGPNA